jgi:hypothetical protein
MERWNIPKIESQYKVLGTEQFFKILKFVNQLTLEKPENPFETLLSELQKKFPEKMTKSWIKHLKMLEMEERKQEERSQKTVLDKFLN